MPLGQGIVEMLGAIPARIEVAGHEPTLRVTAGSFDDALAYAEEVYESPAVLACDRRDRLWPRVTITITTDPQVASGAPPVGQLREKAAAPQRRRIPEPRTPRTGTPKTGTPKTGTPKSRAPKSREPRRQGPGAAAPEENLIPWSLEEIFEHQEAERAARLQVPEQRGSHAADR